MTKIDEALIVELKRIVYEQDETFGLKSGVTSENNDDMTDLESYLAKRFDLIFGEVVDDEESESESD